MILALRQLRVIFAVFGMLALGFHLYNVFVEHYSATTLRSIIDFIVAAAFIVLALVLHGIIRRRTRRS